MSSGTRVNVFEWANKFSLNPSSLFLSKVALGWRRMVVLLVPGICPRKLSVCFLAQIHLEWVFGRAGVTHMLDFPPKGRTTTSHDGQGLRTGKGIMWAN